MLNIILGEFPEDCILNPDLYFSVYKKPDWFNREDVKNIIKTIDNVDAIKDEYMVSPIFGAISPDRLSTGCKNLILLYTNPQNIIYASRAGDNCAPFIVELAKKEDITIVLHHLMEFPEDMTAFIVDTNKRVSNFDEFIDEYIKIRKY